MVVASVVEGKGKAKGIRLEKRWKSERVAAVCHFHQLFSYLLNRKWQIPDFAKSGASFLEIAKSLRFLKNVIGEPEIDEPAAVSILAIVFHENRKRLPRSIDRRRGAFRHTKFFDRHQVMVLPSSFHSA